MAYAPYLRMGLTELLGKLAPGGVFADVKSAFDANAVRAAGHTVWRL